MRSGLPARAASIGIATQAEWSRAVRPQRPALAGRGDAGSDADVAERTVVVRVAIPDAVGQRLPEIERLRREEAPSLLQLGRIQDGDPARRVGRFPDL